MYNIEREWESLAEKEIEKYKANHPKTGEEITYSTVNGNVTFIW